MGYFIYDLIMGSLVRRKRRYPDYLGQKTITLFHLHNYNRTLLLPKLEIILKGLRMFTLIGTHGIKKGFRKYIWKDEDFPSITLG